MPPDNEPQGGARWSAIDTAKVAQLDLKVSSLDADVKQINVRIDGVYKKIDAVATELAHEMRSGIATLANQVTERGTPKFGVIFAGLAVLASAIGMIGGLALSPLQTDIMALKHEIVPRSEHDFRNSEYVARFVRNEAAVRRLEDAILSERTRRIDELITENRMLRSGNK